MRSAKPSPLTSPAADTLKPAWSPALALDLEARRLAARWSRSISCRTRRLAEDHIGGAGIGAAVVVAGGADEDVVEAVAIDVARRRDAAAGLVAATRPGS